MTHKNFEHSCSCAGRGSPPTWWSSAMVNTVTFSLICLIYHRVAIALLRRKVIRIHFITNLLQSKVNELPFHYYSERKIDPV